MDIAAEKQKVTDTRKELNESLAQKDKEINTLLETYKQERLKLVEQIIELNGQIKLLDGLDKK